MVNQFIVIASDSRLVLTYEERSFIRVSVNLCLHKYKVRFCHTEAVICKACSQSYVFANSNILPPFHLFKFLLYNYV